MGDNRGRADEAEAVEGEVFDLPSAPDDERAFKDSTGEKSTMGDGADGAGESTDAAASTVGRGALPEDVWRIVVAAILLRVLRGSGGARTFGAWSLIRNVSAKMEALGVGSIGGVSSGSSAPMSGVGAASILLEAKA